VFKPALTLTGAELYRISVHEIGHIFGLRHSSNTRSIMYDLDLECAEALDSADLASLRTRHKLRLSVATDEVKFTTARSQASRRLTPR
jgi:predicted Zn-dependent protease